jgi:uncharacterized protein (DUF1800 family)
MRSVTLRHSPKREPAYDAYMQLATAQAVIRFGLGPQPGEPAPDVPVSWLKAQLQAPDPAPAGPSIAEGLAALRADREEKPPPGQSRSRALFLRDARAALATALTTDAPFRERLVRFWANHFTVSVRRGQCAALIGPFVAEAIRPHVTGRFGDMLLAVMRHPAMLIYLDNAGSVGPASPAGQRTGRGLNENLARECLELHSLSPLASYTQADVTSFACILTGWSVDLKQDPPGFRFRPMAHEPGPKTLMGRTFPPGEEGGIQALAFLAAHPATHRHLALKLARHFVADAPSPATVKTIAARLRDTHGHLGAACEALIGLREAWRPQTKLRAPCDYLIAALRALGVTEPPPQAQRALAFLGQPLWTAPQPDGWGDRASDWTSPEAMMRRIDLAYALAGKASPRDATALAPALLGPLVRPATLTAMQHAGSRREALALLLASPEFQRR